MTQSFTPTQAKILALLSDGRPHARKEVQACLPDDLACPAALRRQISRLRPKLPDGEEIVCRYSGPRLCYQRIRRIDLIGPG